MVEVAYQLHVDAWVQVFRVLVIAAFDNVTDPAMVRNVTTKHGRVQSEQLQQWVVCIDHMAHTIPASDSVKSGVNVHPVS